MGHMSSPHPVSPHSANKHDMIIQSYHFQKSWLIKTDGFRVNLHTLPEPLSQFKWTVD